MLKLYPSLMAADVLNLQQVIEKIEPYCDGLHMDVMDFHYVPNMTWGPLVVNAVAKIAKKPLYVHLMVDNPGDYISRFNLRDGDIVAVHSDVDNVQGLLHTIHEKRWRASLAISPQVSVNVVRDFMTSIDDVLLMSVEPGFAGQKFISASLEKLAKLVALKKESGRTFSVTMDGGINQSNIAQLCDRGVDGVCLGSAVFADHDPIALLKTLRKLCR